MAKIIRFPKPKIPLTEEETREYYEIKEDIDKASSIREIYYTKKRVKNFLKRVHERYYGKKD